MFFKKYKQYKQYRDFVHWVARWLVQYDFDETSDVFREFACRKLRKMGLAEKNNGVWEYTEWGYNYDTDQEVIDDD